MRGELLATVPGEIFLRNVAPGPEFGRFNRNPNILSSSAGAPITMEQLRQSLAPKPETEEPVAMSELERREQMRLGKRPLHHISQIPAKSQRESPPPPPPSGNV